MVNFLATLLASDEVAISTSPAMWKPRSTHGLKRKRIVEGIASLLLILETTEARPVAGAIVGKSLNSPHLSA